MECEVTQEECQWRKSYQRDRDQQQHHDKGRRASNHLRVGTSKNRDCREDVAAKWWRGGTDGDLERDGDPHKDWTDARRDSNRMKDGSQNQKHDDRVNFFFS